MNPLYSKNNLIGYLQVPRKEAELSYPFIIEVCWFETLMKDKHIQFALHQVF